MNDLVARTLTSACIPSSKEPDGLVRSDGKRPDGLTLVRWKGGNLWPGTSRPYVLWLIHMWQQRQGRPAQQRNVRLSSKSPNILVWRISVSSSQLRWSRWSTWSPACQFLKDLGRRISAQSGDERGVPSCSKGYLLSFSDSTLSCSTTVLRRQTTWANGHFSVYSFLTIFSSPSVSEMPWAKKIIIIVIMVLQRRVMERTGLP